MKYAVLFLQAALSFAAFAQDPWKDIYRESAWEQRDTWQRADDIIKKLNIKAGSKVADIGCHEGYFTMKLASVVRADGKVYAVDISKDKIEKLKKHLDDRKIDNVNAIVGDEDNPHLPPLTLDAVLIVDTYHEMDAHQQILQHIKTSLRVGGRLVICEPISEERKKLTRDEQERKHELGMDYAIADAIQAGFKVIWKQESFVDRVKEKGDMMWLIVCERSN
ncbi:MAG TPA: methyltransferase domain-containing protein [Chryseolinea sp.]